MQRGECMAVRMSTLRCLVFLLCVTLSVRSRIQYGSFCAFALLALDPVWVLLCLFFGSVLACCSRLAVEYFCGVPSSLAGDWVVSLWLWPCMKRRLPRPCLLAWALAVSCFSSCLLGAAVPYSCCSGMVGRLMGCTVQVRYPFGERLAGEPPKCFV